MTISADQKLANEIARRAEERQQEALEREAEQDPLAPEIPGSAEDTPAPDGSATGEAATPTEADGGRIFSAKDAESFRALAGELSGAEGVAVAPLGRTSEPEVLGTLRSGVAWSTAKVPVAIAAIRAGTASEADLRSAITASDNAAAERLWSGLGSGSTAADAATAVVRETGDDDTTVQADRIRSGYTAFGQTDWSLTGQARFAAGLPCVEGGPQVLGLMNAVVAGQRWGLGATGRDAQFKGGWGPGISPGAGDGWLDRQFGVVTIDRTPLAVALATSAPSHGEGTQILSRLAKWVADHASTRGLPRNPDC